MKTRSYAHAYPMGQDADSRSMALYFGISLAIHVIFIGSVIFMPASASRPRLGQGAINVSLVSMPGPPAAPAPAAEASAAPAVKPAPEPVVIPQKEAEQAPKAPVIETPPPKPQPIAPAPPKTVSLAPKEKKPKSKKSLKKKTIDRQKMIDQAVAKVEKKVEKSSSDSVRQAIERLKKKVAQGETPGPQASTGAGGTIGAAGAGVSEGSGGGGGSRALEITDLYKIEVAFQVERHWAFSQQMAGDDRALQASLVFKILPSGEITDIRFTQKSGNSYLDDSAYKAIVKANPVSPHPEGINVPYVTVGLRFTPEGLRK